MALTGTADGTPSLSPAGLYSQLAEVTDRLAAVSSVRANPAELIAGRAALTGFTRAGRVSAGGSSRLLRCPDGWCAVTLSRDSDTEAVPAILGMLGVPAVSAGPWEALEHAARDTAAAALADAAQTVGVPAAALAPERAAAAWPPGLRSRIAPARPGARLAGALVVDLSALWAGPLCARLLGLAGARVVKVESPDRPDGARTGNPDFYDWLHSGHASVTVDFCSRRDTLAALLESADVVIEASRPRALEHLGLSPGTISHRRGQVWLSVTGYGRAADRVAFGDDAAVAGGLTGRDEAGDPVFCADAVADPLTGVCGALAVCESRAAGGGELIDLAMRDVAAAFAAAPEPDHGPHDLRPDGTVFCRETGRTQEVLAPRRPVLPRTPAAEPGADTEAVLAGLAPTAC